MEKQQITTVHIFERAGLGLAPFRYLESVDTAAGVDAMGLRRTNVGPAQSGIDTHTTPGGTCAYCGRAIVVLCEFESADGRRFHVGTDCAEKAGTEAAMVDRKKRTNAKAKASRDARDAKNVAEIAELLAAKRDLLASKPHSKAWRAANGETLLDEAHFMHRACGAAGRVRFVKWLRAQ